MGDKSELLKELRKLSDILRQIESINQRTDAERWRDLLNIRRNLAVQSSLTSKLATEFQPLAADRDTFLTMRQKLSALRVAHVDHQANWPAPIVAQDPEGYSVSAQAVQKMVSEFLDWFHIILAKYP
jgi:hypothetical protein